MPQGTKHQSQKVTKLLNIGDAGSGKTGALACLAEAGYRLIVADFDNGLDILVGILKRKDPKFLENLYYETFTDEMQMAGGFILPKGVPKAFASAMEGFTRWRFPIESGSKETYDLGNIGTWGPDTIVVIDSLGLAGIAALRLIRQINQHQLENFTRLEDFGQAMGLLEGMLQLLYAKNVTCHVVVNSHITYQEDAKKEVTKGFPRALGSKLPPNVGGYFNTMVSTATKGTGQSAKKIIKTVSEAGLELKVPIPPGILPKELPIEDGLLTIFKTLQSEEWVEQPEEETND